MSHTLNELEAAQSCGTGKCGSLELSCAGESIAHAFQRRQHPFSWPPKNDDQNRQTCTSSTKNVAHHAVCSMVSTPIGDTSLHRIGDTSLKERFPCVSARTPQCRPDRREDERRGVVQQHNANANAPGQRRELLPEEGHSEALAAARRDRSRIGNLLVLQKLDRTGDSARRRQLAVLRRSKWSPRLHSDVCRGCAVTENLSKEATAVSVHGRRSDSRYKSAAQTRTAVLHAARTM